MCGGGCTRFTGVHLSRGFAMPDFSQLTQRQREIYDFIRSKIEGRGYGPTVREIGQSFDIKSPNGVMCHLKALEKKGLIIREGFSARAIQLVDHQLGSVGLPLLGNVAAGAAIEIQRMKRAAEGVVIGKLAHPDVAAPWTRVP